MRIFVEELPSDAPVNLSRLTLRSDSTAGGACAGGCVTGREPGRGRDSNGGSGGDRSCHVRLICCCFALARQLLRPACLDLGGRVGRETDLEGIGVGIDLASLLIVLPRVGPDEQHVVGDALRRRVSTLPQTLLQRPIENSRGVRQARGEPRSAARRLESRTEPRRTEIPLRLRGSLMNK